MEELFYCCECQSLCNTTIIDKKQTLTIKGREITLMAPVRECTTCGEEILDEEMDMATLRRFYNEYRKLENLLLRDKSYQAKIQFVSIFICKTFRIW